MKQIEYFITIVDTGSFSKAGEHLHISQSAVSQQIKALEDELGVKLLDRHNRSFSLTPAGELFYHRGAILLYDATQLKKEISRFNKETSASLKIGYLSCYSGNEFEEAVTIFCDIFPDVDFKIISGSHEELYNALRRQDVDLVLNDQRRAFSDDYVNFELVKSHCYIEISRYHPFSKLERLDVTDLKTTPCILVSSKEEEENEMTYYRDIVGFSSNFIFAKTLAEARILTAAGKGFLPLEGIRNDLYYDSAVVRLPLYKKDLPVLRNYCAFWKKENTDIYIEEFAKILKEQFEYDQSSASCMETQPHP